MPRGKRTVFAGSCKDCGTRIATKRYHKQDKNGVSWKEHVEGFTKFCSVCRAKKEVKFKEEKHSS